jgi:hypothetical protein
VKTYLLSLPERLVRSTLGLGAGAAREVGEVVLPDAVRGSQLYKNLVDTTLRFVIEQVGGVEGVYAKEEALQENFLARRTAGNAVEVLGIVAFRASPVWVLAALADVCGAGRQLIPEIADSLKEQGLLDKDAQVTSVDQMLNGLERTSSRLASTINTPPLDIAGLREEWEAIRTEARTIQPGAFPSRETVGELWSQLKAESARQDRSVFQTSSLVAVSAVRAGVVRSGEMVGVAMLDHYSRTLAEMRQTGYTTFAARQFGPYVRAAVDQFSPKRRTLTDRVLDKFRHVQSAANRSR